MDSPTLLNPSEPAYEEFDLEEDELFEMANLSAKQTGIDGIVRISTREGRHGPRVKFFVGRPVAGSQSMSVTIASEPVVAVSSLPPHVQRRAEGPVKEWVRLNREALAAFWTEGTSWMDDEVDAFKAALKPLPR